jgi:hypothetical protein
MDPAVFGRLAGLAFAAIEFAPMLPLLKRRKLEGFSTIAGKPAIALAAESLYLSRHDR